MEAYAKRVGAEFAVVNSSDHPALAQWNTTLRTGANSHFMKLPLLHYYLTRYGRLLFLDDDVLVSPHAPDVFSATPCKSVGAVVEGFHKQGWHSMHGRAFCSLYDLVGSHPGTCSPAAVKHVRIFNSGVMVLSQAHRLLVDGWEQRKLECRILCDQLYLNAMLTRHSVCLHDLGNAFNLPGTAVRRQLATTERGRSKMARMALPPAPSVGTDVAASCFLHLTVLPAKPYTSHYLLKRALVNRDVLSCSASANQHDLGAAERTSMLAALPNMKYDIEKIWCKGRATGCQLIHPPESASSPVPAITDRIASVTTPPPTVPVVDRAKCDAHRQAAAMAEPPMGPAQSNASEVPFAARRVLHRAASYAWDCNTVILLFATGDFYDLAINWAQAATALGIRNYVLVAFDKPLADTLGKFDQPPGLFLPRVASGDVKITKLNVIGERQRFGLRVLESGFNVLFADLDALFLRSPAPILADGDIIGERIWGRPMSLVKKWGAAICTGFYFVRSNPQTIAIFRRTHEMIVSKRAKHPRWQASDQWAINHAVDEQEVEWTTPMPMKPISDLDTKFVDMSAAIGYTRRHRSKFVVLPHVHVARSCPILKHGTGPPPADEHTEVKKYKLWNSLLSRSYALHCFPPHSMPCPDQKHGENGCDKSVIMGSAVHIHGEVVFDQRQGLWFMKAGWEEAIRAPKDKDFFAWLQSQHNGARPGEAPPV
jgi:hypothetical protein